MDRQTWSLPRLAAVAAMAIGLGAGSYGLASAANGSGSGSGSSSSSRQSTTSAQRGECPRGHRRSDETLLTGETASKVHEAALAELEGATIERVETDADGHAKYEAHVVKADGTPATVYVDEDFDVVSVESR